MEALAINDATVKFETWDTTGQERYHSLAPMYYRGVAAAIIVYDITSSALFYIVVTGVNVDISYLLIACLGASRGMSTFM
ncbi:hypothetical protein JHK82_031812 [Glycine max]|nr:hypothetical protein JHK85_032470 [Glycine max]KAG4995078.1 hypothetical protein JHK86_031905 [Glycine max]KAG5125075.1 hypothetical protein JHK82_031812 [Glycine max]